MYPYNASMDKIKFNNIIFLSFIILFATSCVDSTQLRYDKTISLTKQNNWDCQIMQTKKFNINYCFSKELQNNQDITFFIEGDGFSWVTPSQPSSNPTPNNPIALKVAMSVDKNNTIYLSRPCQNILNDDFKNCTQEYWTNMRFSDDVIEAMSETIDNLKVQHKINKVTLVGYSGGGALSLLLATKRDDIEKVITIASNIDTEKWTSYHNITPLESINPASLNSRLKAVKQIHFVGELDKIVPSLIVESYISNFENKDNIKQYIIKDFTHSCCWENSSQYWYLTK